MFHLPVLICQPLTHPGTACSKSSKSSKLIHFPSSSILVQHQASRSSHTSSDILSLFPTLTCLLSYNPRTQCLAYIFCPQSKRRWFPTGVGFIDGAVKARAGWGSVVLCAYSFFVPSFVVFIFAGSRLDLIVSVTTFSYLYLFPFLPVFITLWSEFVFGGLVWLLASSVV